MTNYLIVKEGVDGCACVVLVVKEDATIEKVGVVANVSNEKANIAIRGIFMSIFVHLKSQGITNFLGHDLAIIIMQNLFFHKFVLFKHRYCVLFKQKCYIHHIVHV
jgi:hypothetical protein